MILVDTDIVIDVTRGLPSARDFFAERRDDIALSVVTLTELHAGFRNKREERQVTTFYNFFEHYGIDEEIAILAGRFRKSYMKSHNAGVADCLIAATAEVHGMRVATLNEKHYPMVKKILVPYKKR